jgi:hypothetical protein
VEHLQRVVAVVQAVLLVVLQLHRNKKVVLVGYTAAAVVV